MGTIGEHVNDLGSYIFITLATVINWESMKGDIAFAIGMTLAVVRMYKYVCDIADRRAAKKAEQIRKETEKINQNENTENNNPL